MPHRLDQSRLVDVRERTIADVRRENSIAPIAINIKACTIVVGVPHQLRAIQTFNIVLLVRPETPVVGVVEQMVVGVSAAASWVA